VIVTSLVNAGAPVIARVLSTVVNVVLTMLTSPSVHTDTDKVANLVVTCTSILTNVLLLAFVYICITIWS